MIGTLANNRYRILEQLGTGGTGAVYRTVDTLAGGREVALKVLLAHGQNVDLVEHFKVEFGLMTRLRHPNLPEVYDFGVLSDSGCLFFTCELIRGRDLLKATEGLPLAAVCEVGVQVCRALEYIHSRGLVHYDVKPSNILVAQGADGTPLVKLLDLGLAAEARTVGGETLRGTLAYMAPEIARGDPVDLRADLYALGVTLYQAVCRRLPFAGGSGVEMLWQHLESKVAPPSTFVRGVPAAFDAVVLRLLAKDPADRYPSANRVIEALGDAIGVRFAVETRETRAGYIASSRFVARKEALEAVHAALRARCRIGDGAGPAVGRPLVLLTGERGSGKSRLQREIKYFLQLNQVSYAEGTCRLGAKGLFAPWAEILRQLLPRAAPDDRDAVACAAELVKLVPEWGERFGTAPSAPLDPQRERLRIMGKVTEYLCAEARRDPMVLWIDNLHWADDASLELLHFLVRYLAVQGRASGKPGSSTVTLRLPARLLLGANRAPDQAASPEGERLLSHLRDEGHLIEVALPPLGADDVGALLESMLGVPKVPIAFAERIARDSGGNPFFIEEIMRSLVEEGHELVRHGEWAIRSDQLDRIRLPASISDALHDRLARLEKLNLPILRVLSLAELPMPTHWIARAAGMALPATISLLGSLAGRGLVQRERAGEINLYALTSNSLKGLVAGAMEDAERQSLHRRLAALIEEDARTPLEERVEALAYHYTQAASFEKCIEYSERAAERAARMGFRKKALETVTFAIDALETKAAIGLPLSEGEDRRAAGLYRRRARLTLELGQYEEAARDLDLARDFARRAGDVAGAAEALLLLASIAKAQGRPAVARVAAEEALDLGRTADLEAVVARAQGVLGQLQAAEGAYDLAECLYEEALGRFQTLGDRAAEAEVTLSLAQTCTVRGDCARALDLLRGVIAIREQFGDRAGNAEALDQVGLLHALTGDFAAAEAHHRKALALHEAVGNLEGRLSCLGNLAALALARGRWEEAGRGAGEVYRRGREVGHTPAVARAALLRALARLRTGRYDDAYPLLEEAVAGAHKAGQHRLEAWGLLGQGELYLRVGAFLPARETLGRVLAETRSTSDPEGQAAALTLLALAHARGEEAEAMRRSLPLAEDAVDVARRLGSRPLLMEALSALADVSRRLGRLPEAGRATEEALDLAESLGSEPALARGLCEQASVLVLGAGGGSVAGALLDRAAAMARRADDAELMWRIAFLRGNLWREGGGEAEAAACEREAREMLCLLRGRVPGMLGTAFWDFPERRRAAQALGIET